MSLINLFFDKVFGESMPPSASDGDDSAWDQKKFNRTVRKQLPRSRADAIQRADSVSAERYDQMDGHIAHLRKMAIASRERKALMRLKREALATA